MFADYTAAYTLSKEDVFTHGARGLQGGSTYDNLSDMTSKCMQGGNGAQTIAGSDVGLRHETDLAHRAASKRDLRSVGSRSTGGLKSSTLLL